MTHRRTTKVRRGAHDGLRRVVAWFFDQHGADLVAKPPFYCDPERIGAFAVARERLAAGEDDAVFRVFVTLSMYQALRDVVIMRQQRTLPLASMRVLADLGFVEHAIENHACAMLRSRELFDDGCDVSKHHEGVDCGNHPGSPCHVKDATRAFNRMADMGKLPTSAWFRLWRDGGLRKLLVKVCGEEPEPTRRAVLLVDAFARVHRVGRKLATMFVSALSTPALAPGLTPWFPEIDGNNLVVIDTNVARAVDTLRESGALKTYDAREQWIREQARRLDLREYGCDLPANSPRLVQQALYVFCSKSNRIAQRDACAERESLCERCSPELCPFTVAHPRNRTVGDS